jgi:hypothetical protein
MAAGLFYSVIRIWKYFAHETAMCVAADLSLSVVWDLDILCVPI